MPIRTLIVDDEPVARERLRELCESDPTLRVVGECQDGRQAIEKIREVAPELVFLDIQMSGVDGFRVIETIGAERMPFVVFTTAFDTYALRAFDVDAVDYLLKPFGEGRFPVVEKGERLVFLDPDDIDCIEAQRNYVMVRARQDSYMLRCSMKRVEEMLAPELFLRIHRSVIVNTARIRDLERWFHGEYKLTMQNGMKFTSGRTYREKILCYIRNRAACTISG